MSKTAAPPQREFLTLFHNSPPPFFSPKCSRVLHFGEVKRTGQIRSLVHTSPKCSTLLHFGNVRWNFTYVETLVCLQNVAPCYILETLSVLSPDSKKRGTFLTVWFLRMRWVLWFLELNHVWCNRNCFVLPSWSSFWTSTTLVGCCCILAHPTSRIAHKVTLLVGG